MRFALVFALVLSQGATPTPPQHQVTASTTKSAEPSTRKQEPAKSLWQRTRSDPVAFYTFVLAIFTGLLVIVSAIQGGFLLRADRTARITANAALIGANAARDQADISRDAFVRLERAFVTVPRDRMTMYEDKGFRQMQYSPYNFGKVPATILEVGAIFTAEDKPPQNRNYRSGDREFTIYPEQAFPMKTLQAEQAGVGPIGTPLMLFFFGYVRYSDMHKVRQAGFSFLFDPTDGKWNVYSGLGGNYDRDEGDAAS
jgi:hypothetical protein